MQTDLFRLWQACISTPIRREAHDVARILASVVTRYLFSKALNFHQSAA
ncbi:hypothetical protein KCP74_09475 [Salmonella enterica subsp. enterica]|nr:hypothetical protein KCP74_09475 [Salmonella enterica subsp. enterica]